MANLLFVDDEELLCSTTQHYFEKNGHNIDTVHEHTEALPLLEKKEYDVVILDIHLPGALNGIDILEKIKDEHKEVILITGKPSVDTAASAVRSGAFDYIIKPFKMQELSNVVSNAMQQKKEREQSKRLQDEMEKYQLSLEKTMLQQIQEIRKSHKMTQIAHVKSLRMLAKAAEYHDDATGLHINRVSEYSYILAKNLGLPEDDQEIIKHAAPMHDVGKVGVPYQILTKPGKLTPAEFALIQKHCTIGYEILKDEEHPYHKASAVIALSHQEHYNGEGYPYGMSGKDIPLYGRIVMVADVFDALVSERVYKFAWHEEDALKYIEEQKGKHFDPLVAECFLDSFQEIKNAKENIDSSPNAHSHVHPELTILKDNVIKYNSKDF